MTTTDRARSDTEGRKTPLLRRDFRSIQKLYRDKRPAERLIFHYEIELALADKLRYSTRENRNRTYREVYSELHTKVIDHPQRTRSRDSQRTDIAKLARALRHFIKRGDRVLEVGAGDAQLSRSICDRVTSVVAVDIDDSLNVGSTANTPNFRFVVSEGVGLPLPTASISLAISNQVLEHIHPDDTVAHLREVNRVLSPGGRYLIVTPNAICGPHDVSRYFDSRARGMHLWEFDAKSIRDCLRSAGFNRLTFYAARGGYVFFPMPYWLARGFDLAFSLVPSSLHTPILRNKPIRALLGLTVVAYK